MRKQGSKTLQEWEVRLIKAMFRRRDEFNNQDILSYFTRPGRSINPARISEIQAGESHSEIVPAADEELNQFLLSQEYIDPDTGLSVIDDELVIKAREAMIAAVQIFNSTGLIFRSELFIVTAMIAWTYLLQSWFNRENIEIRRMKGKKVETTKAGAEVYKSLSELLKHEKSPVPPNIKNNIEFLLNIRHEIEHRYTSQIDDALGAKFQACCINFNNLLKEWFGPQCSLERRLKIALQFVTFDIEHKSVLKNASNLPKHIDSSISNFEKLLSDDQINDPAYKFNVAFVPVIKPRQTSADLAVEFVKVESDDAEQINQILFKEVEKPRYPAKKVVSLMNQYGFKNFKMSDHINLWKSMNARDPKLGYGKKGDYDNWVWNDKWIATVKKFCESKGDRFR